MIDKTKYLYWVDPDNPSFEEEVVWRELYSRIGYIFHIVQMVEYNIANILAVEEFEKEKKTVFRPDDIARIHKKIDAKFENLSKATFGQLKSAIQASAVLKQIDEALIKRVVDYRNYLAHQCFKEKLLSGGLKTIEEVDAFVDELNEYETIVMALNEYLLPIFQEKKIRSVFLDMNAKS